MTPLLQTVDFHWNKRFKSSMRSKWIDWLRSGEKEVTKSGKRKRASYDLVADWVSQSWKELPEELIQRSFIECGSIVTDGDQGTQALPANFEQYYMTKILKRKKKHQY
jgi:Fe-S cluster assembly scaffold protein SufB